MVFKLFSLFFLTVFKWFCNFFFVIDGNADRVYNCKVFSAAQCVPEQVEQTVIKEAIKWSKRSWTSTEPGNWGEAAASQSSRAFKQLGWIEDLARILSGYSPMNGLDSDGMPKIPMMIRNREARIHPTIRHLHRCGHHELKGPDRGHQGRHNGGLTTIVLMLPAPAMQLAAMIVTDTPFAIIVMLLTASAMQMAPMIVPTMTNMLMLMSTMSDAHAASARDGFGHRKSLGRALATTCICGDRSSITWASMRWRRRIGSHWPITPVVAISLCSCCTTL